MSIYLPHFAEVHNSNFTNIVLPHFFYCQVDQSQIWCYRQELGLHHENHKELSFIDKIHPILVRMLVASTWVHIAINEWLIRFRGVLAIWLHDIQVRFVPTYKCAAKEYTLHLIIFTRMIVNFVMVGETHLQASRDADNDTF